MKTKQLVVIEVPADFYDEFVSKVADGLGYKEREVLHAKQPGEKSRVIENPLNREAWLKTALSHKLKEAYATAETREAQREAAQLAKAKAEEKLKDIK